MIRSRTTASGKKVWEARVGAGPQRTFDRKKDAEEYEEDQRKQRRRGRAGLEVQQGPITFAELVAIYELNFQPGAWRKHMISYSTKRWGEALVRTIQPQAYGAWLHALPYAEKTKKHILESARQVFNAGVEWGYLSRSPVRPRAFKPPSDERATPIQPFESWAEVERVCELLSPVGSSLVKFACATGVRLPGEAVDLDWSQVRFPTKEVTVLGTKTENAPRTIPLSRLAQEALSDLPRSLSGRVFVGKSGGRFDYANWRDTEWRDALALAGLQRRTPYECRHTFATLALQAGAQIEDVSKVLGHSDIGITLRYYRKWTRPMMDRLRVTLDTIDAEQEEARVAE